jgi:hypothetical protein
MADGKWTCGAAKINLKSHPPFPHYQKGNADACGFLPFFPQLTDCFSFLFNLNYMELYEL